MMNRLPDVVVAVLTAVVLMGLTGAAWSQSPAMLGINLSGLADWSTEQPFYDAFRQARTWASQQPGKGWNQGPPLTLDQRGWVTRLQPGAYAEAAMFTEVDHLPPGVYRLTWQGRGRLEMGAGARVVASGERFIHFELLPQRPMVSIRLMEVDPADYLRDIRVWMPDAPAESEAPLFRAAYVARAQRFDVLRMMDLMATNDSPVRTWSDRPRMDDAVWTRRGLPVEAMVALSNRTGASPWFCMPHLADDQYVREFALYVRDHLSPGVPIYVEYSNEVWNSQFEQAREARRRGVALGLAPADQPVKAGLLYYARRSREVFAIWNEVFGDGSSRLVRVLSGQAANDWTNRVILSDAQAAEMADAFAIAPYFGGPLSRQDPRQIVGWTLEELLAHCRDDLARVAQMTEAARGLAEAHRLRLIAYEGGQHLAHPHAGEHQQAVDALFDAANRDPRMGDLYLDYLRTWERHGGELMVLFASMSRYGRYGRWGLWEHEGQAVDDAPKWRAVMAWLARKGSSN